jgi:hypothetical protein
MLADTVKRPWRIQCMSASVSGCSLPLGSTTPAAPRCIGSGKSLFRSTCTGVHPGNYNHLLPVHNMVHLCMKHPGMRTPILLLTLCLTGGSLSAGQGWTWHEAGSGKLSWGPWAASE